MLPVDRKLTTDDLGRTVRKAGRTTGITEGTITSVDVDRLQVDMGDTSAKIASFSDHRTPHLLSTFCPPAERIPLMTVSRRGFLNGRETAVTGTP